MKSYKELDDELRALRSEYKANPSEELKEQILLIDKKLRDIIILTERDKQIFLDAINNPPEPNEELMKFCKEYKDINNMKKNFNY